MHYIIHEYTKIPKKRKKKNSEAVEDKRRGNRAATLELGGF